MESLTFSKVFPGEYLKIITKYSERIKEILDGYDVVIFMARKAVCFYEAMIINEVIPSTTCQVISSRVLDYNIISKYKGKRIAVIDDVVVKGTSLERVVSILKDNGIHPFVLVVACDESFPSTLGDDKAFTLSNTYISLEKTDIYKFAGMITEYIEASMCSFNIDQPIFNIPFNKSALQTCLCHTNAIDISSGLQMKFGITSTVIFYKFDVILGESNILNVFKESILKIRFMSDGNQMIAVPFVLFQEITNSELDALFSYIQTNDITTLIHTSNKRITAENKLKIINYFFSELLLTSIFDNANIIYEKLDVNDIFQFSESTYELFIIASERIKIEFKDILSCLEMIPLDFSKFAFSEIISASYQAISTININEQNYYNSNGEKLSEEIITYESLCKSISHDSTNKAYLVSCVIDVFIDRGMIVPAIVHTDDGLVRAYKMGEYSKLTKSQLMSFASMLYKYQENIANSLSKTEFEKLCVLFFNMAIKRQFFEQQVDYEEDCYSICYSLYGPRVTTSNKAYNVSTDSALATDFYDRNIITVSKNGYTIRPLDSADSELNEFAAAFAYEYSELKRVFAEVEKNRTKTTSRSTQWNMYVHTFIQYLTLRAIGRSKKNQFLSLCAELYQVTLIDDVFFSFNSEDVSISEKILSGINSGLWKFWCYRNDALNTTTKQIYDINNYVGVLLAIDGDSLGDKNPTWDTIIQMCGELLYKTAFFLNEALKAKHMSGKFRIGDDISETSSNTEEDIKTIFTLGSYYNNEFKKIRHDFEMEVQTQANSDNFDEWLNRSLLKLKKECRLQLDLCDLILETNNPNHIYIKKVLIVCSYSAVFPKNISDGLSELCLKGIHKSDNCKVYSLPDQPNGTMILTEMLDRLNITNPLLFLTFNISERCDGAVQIEQTAKGTSLAKMINKVICQILKGEAPPESELLIISQGDEKSFEHGGYSFTRSETSDSAFECQYTIKKYSIHKKSIAETTLQERFSQTNIIMKEVKVMNVGSQNAQQINNFEGDNNQAFFQMESNLDLLKLELEKLIPISSQCEKIEIQSAISAIEQKDEKRVISFLKKAAEFGSNVLSKITADICVAYMRANGIIP